jgi:hypothetical protein
MGDFRLSAGELPLGLIKSLFCEAWPGALA